MKREFPRVMTIAGSDSGGCAGIQADLKTISALKCFPTTVITAVTAQNTTGVNDIFPIPVNILKNQFAAILEDIGTNAIKVGMLHSSEVIVTVRNLIKKSYVKNIVIDPVMVATSGDILLEKEAIDTLRETLIPLASILTPNVPEASILLNRELKKQSDFRQAAKEICSLGCRSVLLKAGHMKDETLIDIFYDKPSDTTLELKTKKIRTKNTHGTGCTISSAIAAWLARGETLENAVKKAKKYLTAALIHGSEYQTGKGHGPVHHFHELWKQLKTIKT